MRTIKTEKLIIYLFFYLLPLFDSLTGLLIKLKLMGEASIGSPSQLIKFFLWVLLFVRFVKRGKRHEIYTFVLTILFYALFESVIAVICNSSVYAYMFGILNIFKISYLWLFYLFFNQLLKAKFLTIEDLLHLFKTNGLICVSLIIITTVLHINLSTYATGNFGSKGLFPSGNGISVYIGALSFLSLIIAKKEGGIKNYLQAFLMIIGSSIIGTKASIIFLVLNFLYFCFFVVRHGKIIVLGVFVALIVSNISLFEMMFDVIIFRFKNKGNIFSFIMSSRDVFVKDALAEFYTDGLFALRIFFGLGAFLSFRMPNAKNVYDTLENDIFDIFFMYGILGLILYFSVIFKTTCKIIVHKHPEWILFSSAVFVYSMIAGHSVFNQTSGVLLALCPLIGKYKPFSASFYLPNFKHKRRLKIL